MALFKRKKKVEQKSLEIKTDDHYEKGLSKSRNRFKEGLLSLFGRGMKISDDFMEDIEAFLYESDLGASVCDMVMERIELASRKKNFWPMKILEILSLNFLRIYSKMMISEFLLTKITLVLF